MTRVTSLYANEKKHQPPLKFKHNTQITSSTSNLCMCVAKSKVAYYQKKGCSQLTRTR